MSGAGACPVVTREVLDNLRNLRHEVQVAADVILKVDTGGTWGSFTCTEIEALADVFRAAGRDDVADFIIAEHGESDEDDDLHTPEGTNVRTPDTKES